MAGRRPVVGDRVKILEGRGEGNIAKITADDEDACPYNLEGYGTEWYSENQVELVDQLPSESTGTVDDDDLARQLQALVAQSSAQGTTVKIKLAAAIEGVLKSGDGDDALAPAPSLPDELPECAEQAVTSSQPCTALTSCMLGVSCALACLALRCSRPGDQALAGKLCDNELGRWIAAVIPLGVAGLGGVVRGIRMTRGVHTREGVAQVCMHLGATSSAVLTAGALQGHLDAWLGSALAAEAAASGGKRWVLIAAPLLLGALLAFLARLCGRGSGRGGWRGALATLLWAAQPALIAVKLDNAAIGFSWHVVVVPAALVSLLMLLNGLAHVPCRQDGSGCNGRFATRLAHERDLEVGEANGVDEPPEAQALRAKALRVQLVVGSFVGFLGLVSAWATCARLDGTWRDAWPAVKVHSASTAEILVFAPLVLGFALMTGSLLLQHRWARRSARKQEEAFEASIGQGETISGNTKNGFGQKKWSDDNTTYEGRFRDGKPHGRGIMTWDSGNRYDGNWKNGKMEGRGEMTFGPDDDKRRYKGSWVKGKKAGRGKMEWADESIYDGKWEDDMQHGKGVFKGGDGREYLGEYKFGLEEGKGAVSMADGNEYVGKWRVRCPACCFRSHHHDHVCII